MSYKDETIKDTIQEISDNKIYLPAIQRKFVWGPQQIIELFDSIMKGYPIGTFLFWKLRNPEISKYTFYKFILHYHEKDRYLNETSPDPETKPEIVGVLDGQQRLSSMYLALQGSYAYKTKYRRHNDDSAYPKRELYLNLLSSTSFSEDEEEESKFEFRFLTQDNYESKVNSPNEFWFPVRKILQFKSLSEVMSYTMKNNSSGQEVFIKNISTLYSKIVEEKLISYFLIENKEIEEILPIFVRVNSSGTVLSKTDLLFSTIVANWQEGREEIEQLIEQINNKGFYFSNDFVMRACLTLTDSPILFKVKNFKRDNIQKIRDDWPRIKTSIIATVDLLKEFGYNSTRLTSQMAAIIIAYYIHKGGHINESSKSEIKKYITISLVNQVYGGQPDRVISRLRDSLNENNNKFLIENFNTKLDIEKQLKVTPEKLEEILSYNKGAYTFIILSILYPHLKLSQVEFHQDHIHPSSMFSEMNLAEAGVNTTDNDILWDWNRLKNQLPNLQLLEGTENESKNSTHFKDWYASKIPDDQKDRYLDENFIPKDVSFDIKDFEEFFLERKKLISNKLKNYFHIEDPKPISETFNGEF